MFTLAKLEYFTLDCQNRQTNPKIGPSLGLNNKECFDESSTDYSEIFDSLLKIESEKSEKT